jgi:hypothetical protein
VGVEETVDALPTVRIYPKTDRSFADDVAAAVEAVRGDPDEATTILRSRYPRLRISIRSAIAGFDDRPVWYAFRDGTAVNRSDGCGAMRLWTPIERETRRSVDLIEWTDRLLRQSLDAQAAFASRRSFTAL